MHVVIINGSPRIKKFSNTEVIINYFTEGLKEEGISAERYAISDRNNWEKVRDAYIQNTEIIIALPLYVENVPGLLLEFLETLPQKDENTHMSFILQGGFSEAGQLRCGEAFLKELSLHLGVKYGGTLIKGDNFGIRVSDEAEIERIAGPYKEMGKAFAKENGFLVDTVNKFAGPEYYPFPIRCMLQLIFKTIVKKRFSDVSKNWGCERALDYRPWEELE